ncbi:LysR family transcriptional regulator [Pseudomonas citronellolis]|uniref:LysR family transcriptional regulator n=1 Tax=Pseudomonas citronellolis TaxID=53408 RepID=UPI0007186CC5|nr:LysR family transcriptional regulator [Pseudomonas citronellolis]KRV80561.1 LysR family transcriptional regulator [Pseudomonas citronellolis]KRW79051.1 LysR family transcriptional regulator [Pseudomonas citronellolis]
MQYRLEYADLSLVLALVRGGSLARAAELLAVDVSTVFRAVRRLEKALGMALFEKGRAGYLPSATAQQLARQAELAEQALEAARVGLEQGREVLSGTVRLTCTDAVLHGLLLPALGRFMGGYPGLHLELSTSNAFANLSRRDADVALRLTTAPPEYLVGRCLGEVRYALCAHESYLAAQAGRDWSELSWIAPDEFMPDHPSVAWRRQLYPALTPAYRCGSILSVLELCRAGLGLAALPDYLLREGDGLRVLQYDLPGCATALWLLTRPDCRALRTVVTLFEELARHIRLPPPAGH